MADQDREKTAPTDAQEEKPATSNYVSVIERVRALQLTRTGHLNAHLNQAETDRLCHCEPPVKALLVAAAERLDLSARGYYRALRVARTITDMDQLEAAPTGSDADRDDINSPGLSRASISRAAIAEALSYRPLAIR